jgi:pimeloyl-ACP methyl ester carboxylesterase
VGVEGTTETNESREDAHMATYVLVPGAWLGGWAWQPVARQLRAKGHEAYPVTLTGLGERSHLARPEVDLATHVTDVVNLVETEDLREVVLVGHSYAGIVVSAAADRLVDRLASVVYVDSGPFPDGTVYLDTQEPEARALAERAAAEQGDGWRLPLPSWEELEKVNGASLAGLDTAARAAFRARATDQPLGTYTQPVRRSGAAGEQVAKVLVSCSFPLDQVRQLIASGHPWFAALGGPEWRLVELATGHWPMFSVPGELAATLDELA